MMVPCDVESIKAALLNFNCEVGCFAFVKVEVLT